MKNLDNRTGPIARPERKSWKALRDTGRFGIIEFKAEFFLGEKEYWDSCLNLEGNRLSEYLVWLRTKKRLHNKSNVIEFTRIHQRPIHF
jgi:hypothetical protein